MALLFIAVATTQINHAIQLSCSGLVELPGSQHPQHVAAGWDVAVVWCKEGSLYQCRPSQQAQHPGEQWTNVQFSGEGLVTAMSAGEKHRCMQTSCLAELSSTRPQCGSLELSRI